MPATDLRRALETLRCDSADHFWFQGLRHRPESGLPIEEAVAELLYATLHCRMPSRSAAVPAFSNWVGARQFVDRLSRANSGTGTWQGGWVARSVDPDGQRIVERRGVQFRATPAECRGSAVFPGPGEAVQVRLAKEYREMVPGFYLALGEADDVRDTVPIVRIYWNVTPRGAEHLVGVLTRALNRDGVPFQLKILGEPLRFDRCDSAVLYLPREWIGRALGPLREVYTEVRRWLRAPVSHLVKPMVPGVGLAEDPGDGTSYGEHRTRMLARLFLAQGAGFSLGRLIEGLADLGFDLDALYLNPGSRDDFPVFDARNGPS